MHDSTILRLLLWHNQDQVWFFTCLPEVFRPIMACFVEKGTHFSKRSKKMVLYVETRFGIATDGQPLTQGVAFVE
jgi:hypothetical protein